MVRIKPFRGFFYNLGKVDALEEVLTPPYDVISDEQVRELYAKSEYNFSRVLLPRPRNGTNKYQNAAKILNEWIEGAVLVQDDVPAIYAYSQAFPLNGKGILERLGFIALTDVSNEGDILPHEKTLQKPFEDRLELTKATGANFGLIFTLYDDRPRVIDGLLEKHLAGREEDLKFVDENDVVHRLWKVTDASVVDKVVKEMEQYSCVIADGHHRFKVAREFHEHQRKFNGGGENSKFTMVCFINSFHEGLVILPVNRLVYNVNPPRDFFEKLGEWFDVEEKGDITTALEEVRSEPVMIDKKVNLKNHVFCVHDCTTAKSYRIRLRDPLNLEIGGNHSDVYAKTDINILHELILEKTLGISPAEQFRGEKVEFVKGDEECIRRLKEGERNYTYGFFVNPPLLREVFLTSRNGETMPQKSTYFYPKLYSGMVVRKLAD
ncbi:MAG: DUF1015 domain-containing protein [Promethearchaeota archaeon]